MTPFSDPASRAYARMTGVAYLTIALAGGFSIAYVPSVLHDAANPAATVEALRTSRVLFNLGIAGDTVMMLAEILATAMLYFMFRPVNATLSFAAALARFAMVAVMASMLFFHAGLIAVVDGAALSAFSAAQQVQMASLFYAIHDAGVWIWQIFFFAHLVLLGTLVVRSGLFPRVLGFGLIIGGFGYLLDSAYAFMFADVDWLGVTRAALLAVVTLSEVGFALWLLIVGPRNGEAKTANYAATAGT